MAVQDFLIPFILISLTEFGDKTQLAIFALSSKEKIYGKFIFGLILAIILADILAILVGAYFSKYFPLTLVEIFAGVTFIIFGIFMLFKNDEEEIHSYSSKTPFFSSFLLFFFYELGDKTQIAAGVLAAKFNPYLVLLGTVFSVVIISFISMFLGTYLLNNFKRKTLSLLSSALFISMGIFSLLNVKWF